MDNRHDGSGVAKIGFGVKKNCVLRSTHKNRKSNFTIYLNDGPKQCGDCKDDMLIGDIKKICFIFVDPVVGLSFTASLAKPRFTSKIDTFSFTARIADIFNKP